MGKNRIGENKLQWKGEGEGEGEGEKESERRQVFKFPTGSGEEKNNATFARISTSFV